MKCATSVLAIIVARIGDTLLATPALRALKESLPTVHLTVLAHPKRKTLLEGLSFIDTLGSIEKHSAFWRGRWPGKTYDFAVVWGHDRALLTYALRKAKRVFAFDGPNLPVDSRLVVVPRPNQSIHAVHERMLLSEAAGATTTDFGLAYELLPWEKDHACRWLASLQAKRPLVGIQPVSFPTKAHRDWPLASFTELIGKLANSFPSLTFVILGDYTSGKAAEHLQKTFPGRVISAVNMFTIRETAAVIGELDLYIGVDTGPTHIAGALRTPMVALYHCSYPGRNLAPIGHPLFRMIEHPATGTASASVDLAMDQISVATVENAAVGLLIEQGIKC